MSDDLISRKALTEGRVENDPVRIAAMCAPTAFDKEKVIEELQRPDPIIRTFVGKKFTTIERAIEIVEKGGIE